MKKIIVDSALNEVNIIGSKYQWYDRSKERISNTTYLISWKLLNCNAIVSKERKAVDVLSESA